LLSKKEAVVMGLVSGIDRVRMTGPLASFAGVYAVELGSRGYTLLTVVTEVRQVARFSGWMRARGLSTRDLDVGEVEAFLSWQRSTGRWRSSWSRPGLACLLEVLRDLGVVEAERPVAGSPTDRLVGSFERYLLAERALAAGTVAGTRVTHGCSWTGCRPARPGWLG
jgi:integrase/recombinase XerD